MNEYAGCCKKRNKGMEVADHTIDLYDGACVCDELGGVSVV